jgi:hypothetical protein
MQMDELTREVAGALKQTIDAHGPITEIHIGSAAKRIATAIREAAKRERDRMMATTARRPRNE